MTERPILMSGAMVRACLRELDPKGQTRRVVMPQPPKIVRAIYAPFVADPGNWQGIAADDLISWYGRCPYGVPGDRLWVRETYAIVDVDVRRVSIARAERMPTGKTLADTDGGLEIIEVDSMTAAWARERVDQERWKPAIFMPRWACRLVLEVIGVRVERLQAITAADAEAEGVGPAPGGVARSLYRCLWDSLNEKRGYGWATNPWVWVVSFRRAAALKAAA